MKTSIRASRMTAFLSGVLLAIPPLAAADPSTTLWYQQPAKEWQREALPIGNGRIGAMIFGGIGHETKTIRTVAL